MTSGAMCPPRYVLWAAWAVLLCLGSLGWASEAASAQSPPGTRSMEITSRSGEAYRIFSAIPSSQPPANGFPVIYVLDGNAYFASAVSAYRDASPALPPAVIIGVGYPTEERFDRVRRTYDYTTLADPDNLPPSRIAGGWPDSGGADAFLHFLEDELKPRVAAEVPIDSDSETILGHSFGGLFVMHALFTRPSTFDTYVAISPSGWWNDYALLNAERSFSRSLDQLESPVRLMIAVGELELSDDAGPAAALEPTPAKHAFGTTRDFAQRLAGLPSEHWSVVYREFEELDHGSVVPAALESAVPFALRPEDGDSTP